MLPQATALTLVMPAKLEQTLCALQLPSALMIGIGPIHLFESIMWLEMIAAGGRMAHFLRTSRTSI